MKNQTNRPKPDQAHTANKKKKNPNGNSSNQMRSRAERREAWHPEGIPTQECSHSQGKKLKFKILKIKFQNSHKHRRYRISLKNSNRRIWRIVWVISKQMLTWFAYWVKRMRAMHHWKMWRMARIKSLGRRKTRKRRSEVPHIQEIADMALGEETVRNQWARASRDRARCHRLSTIPWSFWTMTWQSHPSAASKNPWSKRASKTTLSKTRVKSREWSSTSTMPKAPISQTVTAEDKPAAQKWRTGAYSKYGSSSIRSIMYWTWRTSIRRKVPIKKWTVEAHNSIHRVIRIT